ncbi:hypothetical protein [Peribacillus frigoritolerans]|uniref:hypothetical protein n=1 Tax=Peribacillus frigoritolerans TaxID=450367 RepID=UPI0023DA4276|nr:hypothetical protein [Peribacillus frigoritolerans]MDF1995809.1 hypothetical protein [Peribacillus frigoritolerans]
MDKPEEITNDTANLATIINRNVFTQMSIYAITNGMKKKEVVELAIIEFLNRQK